jgi:hypothetical protein
LDDRTVPSVVAAGSLTVHATEGADSGAQPVAQFTDPGGPDVPSNYAASIDWGDHTQSPGTITFDPKTTTFSVLGSHTYLEQSGPGPYPVTVTVSHGGAAAGTVTGTAVVADPAVVLTGGVTIPAIEGSALTGRAVATFTDPGGPEPVGDYAASIDWGDNTRSAGTIAFNPATATFTVLGSHTYLEQSAASKTGTGLFPVTVTVTHEGAPGTTALSSAAVADPSVVVTGARLSAVEGAAFSNRAVATFTDPGGPETVGDYAASIDWGDNTRSAGAVAFNPTTGTFAVLGSHTYREQSGGSPGGVYRVTVTVSHEGAPAATATGAAAVADPSVVVTGARLSAVEGAAFSNRAVATFTDPGGPEPVGDYAATIDWGDHTRSAGTVAFNPATATFTVLGSHTYPEQSGGSPGGVYRVTVTVSHEGAPAATASGAAAVADAPLSVTGVPVVVASGTSGRSLTVATFTDAAGAEAPGRYTATINWGDGSAPTQGTVIRLGGTYAVLGSHTFVAPGKFRPVVTVQDEGGTAHATTTAVVGSATERFVAQAYRDILHREADPASLASAARLIDAGTPRTTLAGFLARSAESDWLFVVNAYRRYLGRAPGAAESGRWIRSMQQGMTDERVEASILGSAEYAARHPGGPGAWVSGVFHDLLGRGPGGTEVAFWTGYLSSGKPPADAAYAIATSRERAAITVRDDYRLYLGRAASPAEVNQWVTRLVQATTDESVVAVLVGSPEYYQRATQV